MTINHLPEHEHAFLNADNVVEQIAVFASNGHNDAEIQKFAEATGYVKAVCCCSFGKPYIGDTWNETNKEWIENLDVHTISNIRIVEAEEITTPKAITNADTQSTT
jgi:hypothetical protein